MAERQPARMPGTNLHTSPRAGIPAHLELRLRHIEAQLDRGAMPERVWDADQHALDTQAELAAQPMGDAPEWGLA